MKVEIPAKLKGKKLFDYLVENKSLILAQKKAAIKQADAFSAHIEFLTERGAAKKAADQQISTDATKLKARLIINTTNLFDSHADVHVNGLWSKSLTESILLYLLQEHKMTFKGIISDEITASTKSYTWKQLGAPYDGSTQALVFDVIIDKNRNEYMFEQYAKKFVKNHSVGMRYIKIYMCINDEGYSSEFDNWNKYYPAIANKDDVDKYGYFFAVTEAQCIEGSAVPRGSNFVTPVQSIEEEKAEPVRSTQKKQIAGQSTILHALNKLQKQLN